MIETIGRLVSLGHQVALIGAKNERAYVQSLADRLPSEARSQVTNTAGSLTLGELLALLDGAGDTVLTNDSGPMHMAIALGRPTVCLFRAGQPRTFWSGTSQCSDFL